MSVEPFWKPNQYIPIVGMLAGATVAGIVVALTLVLREVHENRDKIETYLACGASRWEACKPLAQQALLVALAPTVNQMSVIGIIAIPGMMTGALLGGSSVEQAAKLQMIIMFCISASTAFGTILAVILCLMILVDSEHRVRGERIDPTKHSIWKRRDEIMKTVREAVVEVWNKGHWQRRSQSGERGPVELQQRLLR